jgi:hypothetical protein
MLTGYFACPKTNPNVNNAEQFLALNRSSRFTLINNMLEQLSNINIKKSLNDSYLMRTAPYKGDESSSKVKLDIATGQRMAAMKTFISIVFDTQRLANML